MVFEFMLGENLDVAAFHEWSNVRYEDGWRFQERTDMYENSVRERETDPKVKSLPTHGLRGQPINYECMIHDSYRWTSKECRPFSRVLTSEFSPKTDPIFVCCVWDFCNIL